MDPAPAGAGTRRLLVVSAALEGATGAALLIAPAAVASILLGAPLESAAALIVGRLAGAALIALGSACAFARGEARAVVGAMLAYNLGAAILLVAAALDPELAGLRIWPVAGAHLALAGWCAACLRQPRPTPTTRN